MAEGSYNLDNDNIPTFVALPIDAFENNTLQKPEQFRIIKNAIIKTLSDGSLCIIDANDYNESPQQQQLQVTCVPSLDTQVQNNSVGKPSIVTSNGTNVQSQLPVSKPPPPVYKCPKCTEAFDKMASYRKHMMWHRNMKKYKCEKCSAGYNVETNLKIHMAMHGEGKPTCPICNISFQRLASLKSHLMVHQVEELYTCEECGAEFEKEEELSKHLQSHQYNTTQESSNLICSYCNVQFDDNKSYKEHISHHVKVKKMVLSGKKSRKTRGHRDYPHVCNICMKSFSRISLLERHLRVHSGERPYICEHCNRGFNQKGTLQIHLSKHTGVKPFECTLCSAKFNQKGNLRVHVEKTHTAPMPGIKMYKCAHCTCIFKKIASLNVHVTKFHASSEDLGNITNVMNRLKELEEQTTITPDMKPAEKEIVQQNKKVLNDIKASSDIASTSYVRLAESFLDGTVRRYLVMQRKVNDVRWYICSYCDKEFKKPSDLIRHTRVHTREKPFMCKQCGGKFSLKSTLFCHAKTHIIGNSKYYYCHICMKKFSSMRAVTLHLRKHSEKSPNKYLPCNKFSSPPKAKLHGKEFHTDLLEKDSVQVVMKQPLLHTSNGLLPLAPPKSHSDRNGVNGKQFQCLICGIRYSKMPNLKRHLLQHNGERKFKCDQCLKSYFTLHALKEHLLCHSGVRNFVCKICGKKFMTASLLKRHATSHNTHKPYFCPYCNKNFKTAMLCRKHMNVHKKEINLQIHALSETGEIKDLDESDRTKLIGLSASALSANDGVVLTQENAQAPHDNSIEVIKNSIQLISQEPDKSNQQLTDTTTIDIIQSEIDPQLYEVTPNSIEIINNSGKSMPQDPNQIQTIFINCEDLQLSDNLYSQNTDAMLFNSLNDLQDTGAFSMDPINEDFATQSTEVFNSNQIFNVNQIANNEQASTINITDITSKGLKLNNINVGSSKPKTEKSNLILNNINLSDNILTNNIPYYSQSELNLLFNLDAEFEPNNCDLPNDNLNLPDINLSEVPGLNVEPPQETTQEKDEEKAKKKYTCNRCGKMFTNKRFLTRHLQSHNDAKKMGISSHQCSFCEKNFKKHSDLVRHIRTHTGEKPFACDKCEKKFSLKSTLLSHQRTHNPVSHKQFSCIVCNSFFTSKSSLKVHMSVHTGDKSHICTFCPLRFRTAAHRKSHESSYHLNPIRKRPKNKATNLLASVAMDVLTQQDQISLPNNQLTTGGDLENVFVVQQQMPFSGDQLNLLNEPNQNPLAESSQLEPLILQQLQSNFLLQDSLIPSSLIQLDDGTLLNVKTVTNDQEEQDLQANVGEISMPVLEKPRNLECDVCHKKYASKDVLRKHKKIHDKKFRCSKCEKGFDVKEDLDRHEKTHDGYRPFSCFYCANSFFREHSLNTHMKRIHYISLKDTLHIM